MTYRATGDSTTLTTQEQYEEAQRILGMGLEDLAKRKDTPMLPHESNFIEEMAGRLDAGVFPSIKQLWWLRDLKEKYL